MIITSKLLIPLMVIGIVMVIIGSNLPIDNKDTTKLKSDYLMNIGFWMALISAFWLFLDYLASA